MLFRSNTYGATKLLMERTFVSANYHKGNHDVRFICVRYGNVLGSRGSIIPKFVQQVQNGEQITITDPNMTRFNITMNQALDLIMRALKNGHGGEVFVPKLKAYRVADIRDVVLDIMNSNTKTKIISVRPGEKFHETLISHDEIRNTYENSEDYIILEQQNREEYLKKNSKIKKTRLNDTYSSDRVALHTKDELRNIVIKEKLVTK